MAIIRPRLTDFHAILLPQAETDFAIPFLDEDIPLYVDPFLLWRSPSQQDQALHTSLINSFNHLGALSNCGRESEAAELLISLSECDEVGLGLSRTREAAGSVGGQRQKSSACFVISLSTGGRGSFTLRKSSFSLIEYRRIELATLFVVS